MVGPNGRSDEQP